MKKMILVLLAILLLGNHVEAAEVVTQHEVSPVDLVTELNHIKEEFSVKYVKLSINYDYYDETSKDFQLYYNFAIHVEYDELPGSIVTEKLANLFGKIGQNYYYDGFALQTLHLNAETGLSDAYRSLRIAVALKGVEGKVLNQEFAGASIHITMYIPYEDAIILNYQYGKLEEAAAENLDITLEDDGCYLHQRGGTLEGFISSCFGK